jgi:hypothetical protein
MDKQALLDKIQREAELWEAFLDEVGEGRMELPGATGDWTFKDVVAHLSGWRSRTIERLEAGREGKTPTFSNWPAGLEEENEDDLERINQWIYEQNRNRPLSDVLAESRQQYRQIYNAIQAFPEDQLFERNRFDWMHGHPLADVAHFGHFHEEHEPVLRRWLADTNE